MVPACSLRAIKIVGHGMRRKRAKDINKLFTSFTVKPQFLGSLQLTPDKETIKLRVNERSKYTTDKHP
jgi:hypothetical protein